MDRNVFCVFLVVQWVQSNDASIRAWSGELMSCEHESCEQ